MSHSTKSREGVIIDNSPRGQLISLLGAMNLDVAKPWVDQAIEEAVREAYRNGREDKRNDLAIHLSNHIKAGMNGKQVLKVVGDALTRER